MVEKTALTNFWPSFFDPLRQAGSRLTDWLAPATEASQDDGSYRIAMELPGVAEEALLALRESRPLYVLGGFGGCARDIAGLRRTDGLAQDVGGLGIEHRIFTG